MKKLHIIYSLALILLLGSCENFLQVEPQDQLLLDGSFKTSEEVLQGTSPLYGFAWFNFNDKASYAIGDIYGGNMFTNSSEFASFNNYTISQNDIRMFEAWSASYAVVSHANNYIRNMPRVANDNGVDPVIINNCLGEAKFMRAMAFFYLVRLFGEVPVYEDGVKTASQPIIPRIKGADVYAFIVKDLEWAEQNLPANWPANHLGRVTKYAAKAALAKVLLTQKEYAKAKTKLEEVIASGSYHLLNNYRDLFFRSTSNNNAESLFAWQWVANQNWSTQNTHQAFFAASSDITKVGDGWGTVIPSVDLVMAYEPGDLRKRETIMTDGDFYPELATKLGGYTYDLDVKLTETRSSIKKYVVGSPDEDEVGFMSTGINTDIIRYADVLLMYTEAVLGATDVTTDAKALEYFNMVRTRAGLSTKASVTRMDLLHERRIEFAMESQYFYDVVRLLGEQGAMDYFSNIERGRFDDTGAVSTQKYTCTRVKFEIPTSEADQNPLFKEPAQPYDWSNSEYSAK